MSKSTKAEIAKSLKDCYNFLIGDYDYKVIDEESSAMFFYVRYENESLERIISVGIDLRENEFGIAIWKSSDGWTLDENMIEFKDYLDQKGIKTSLQNMSDLNMDLSNIKRINETNSLIFRTHGVKLIKGEEGY